MNQIRLLIADDHAVVRHGLRRYFELLPEMQLAAEAGGGPEALALAPAVNPDVILLDLMMPEMDGIATATALKRLLPQTPILILTTFCTPETVAGALRAGASGFLMKDVGIDELALAIHTVRDGRPYLQAYAAQQLINGKLYPDRPSTRLTSREQQICALIARGQSNKQIGAELRISEKTVSVHVTNVMSKLGFRSRTQLALYALQAGISAPAETPASHDDRRQRIDGGMSPVVDCR